MTDADLFWLVALIAAFFVGTGKGGLPLVASLSVPLMSLVMSPLQAAALLLPVYLVSDLFGVWIYRRSYSVPNLRILIPAGAIGTFIGFLVADKIDENTVRIIIGGVGLAFLAMRQWNRIAGNTEARPATVGRGLFWGSVSGFTSFVSHAGAPAFQMYVLPQKLEKMVFAGTSTILFALINWMKVPPYIALGLMDWGDMHTVLTITPVAILGAWVGYRLTKAIPQRIFFAVVEVALFVISVNLIRVGLAA